MVLPDHVMLGTVAVRQLFVVKMIHVQKKRLRSSRGCTITYTYRI
jgi:hypothetical protein